MGSEWQPTKLGEVIAVNPSRPLSKGADSVYISMQQVESANRTINEIDYRKFKGSGSHFQNGDTLLARITPCLENGKTAFVNFLEEDEVAHGSTEFIVLSGVEGISDNLFVYCMAVNAGRGRYPITLLPPTQSSPSLTISGNGRKTFQAQSWRLPVVKEKRSALAKKIKNPLGVIGPARWSAAVGVAGLRNLKPVVKGMNPIYKKN